MNFKDLKNKEGFTLIELLVVIMIIGILATSAVGGYTSYRRSSLLSLTADDIVSQINFMRDRVVHGDYKSGRRDEIICELEDDENCDEESDENASKCFGFKYGNNELSLFSQEFNVKKAYDVVYDEWVYNGCSNDFSSEVWGGVIDLKKDEIISIDSVKKVGNDDVEENLDTFYLRFSPPEGKVEYFVDDSGFPMNLENIAEVVIRLKYGETIYKKDIVFDIQANTITVRDV